MGLGNWWNTYSQKIDNNPQANQLLNYNTWNALGKVAAAFSPKDRFGDPGLGAKLGMAGQELSAAPVMQQAMNSAMARQKAAMQPKTQASASNQVGTQPEGDSKPSGTFKPLTPQQRLDPLAGVFTQAPDSLAAKLGAAPGTPSTPAQVATTPQPSGPKGQLADLWETVKNVNIDQQPSPWPGASIAPSQVAGLDPSALLVLWETMAKEQPNPMDAAKFNLDKAGVQASLLGQQQQMNQPHFVELMKDASGQMAQASNLWAVYPDGRQEFMGQSQPQQTRWDVVGDQMYNQATGEFRPLSQDPLKLELLRAQIGTEKAQAEHYKNAGNAMTKDAGSGEYMLFVNALASQLKPQAFEAWKQRPENQGKGWNDFQAQMIYTDQLGPHPDPWSILAQLPPEVQTQAAQKIRQFTDLQRQNVQAGYGLAGLFDGNMSNLAGIPQAPGSTPGGPTQADVAKAQAETGQQGKPAPTPTPEVQDEAPGSKLIPIGQQKAQVGGNVVSGRDEAINKLMKRRADQGKPITREQAAAAVDASKTQ